MDKKKRNLTVTICIAGGILLASGLVLFGGFHLIKAAPQEYDVSAEVQDVAATVDLEILEDKLVITTTETTASISEKKEQVDPRGFFESFELDGITFGIYEDYSAVLQEGELTAKEAAKFALDEYAIRYPDKKIEETLFIHHELETYTSNSPSWFITSNANKQPYRYPKIIVVDAITGNILRFVIPYEDPISNTLSKEPWISNSMLSSFMNDNSWTSLAYSYIRTNLIEDNALYFSNALCDYSYMQFGFIRVSCDIESSGTSIPVTVYIDMKTHEGMGYSWFNELQDSSGQNLIISGN